MNPLVILALIGGVIFIMSRRTSGGASGGSGSGAPATGFSPRSAAVPAAGNPVTTSRSTAQTQATSAGVAAEAASIAGAATAGIGLLTTIWKGVSGGSSAPPSPSSSGSGAGSVSARDASRSAPDTVLSPSDGVSGEIGSGDATDGSSLGGSDSTDSLDPSMYDYGAANYYDTTLAG